MHIQALEEQRFRVSAITESYPDKNWSLRTLQTICCRVDETGSAVMCRAGSGRRKSLLLQLVNILNNEICKICCVNAHITKADSLAEIRTAEIRTTIAKIQ